MSEASKQSTKVSSSHPDYEKIANSTEFRELIRRKKRFIITSTVFFVLYYFALPVFTGYFDFLNTKVIGAMNGAYLFALSQFFMAWILAIVYVRHAGKLDLIIDKIIRKHGRKRK
ncbi:DUF485 domain-containing protein [Staphylospora marina]|uniref:DUF485 domain-containing protein n=1 Tax=Staphylospora marina TaxID=2490858 RepID=UPI001F152FE3|nr:DUF485 domain-containing protein [Staphylospora marina]